MQTKQHYLGAALTGLFVLVAYSLTMAPTVTFWDAGEFIAAAFTLGIPHPPGTPLFVNIGRVLCALPLPFAIAPRLNFLSVLCGTAGAVLLYLIAAHLLEKLVEGSRGFGARCVVLGGAAAAAIIPAFQFTEWTNVTEFEVYAVATATILLCSWLTLRMGVLNDPRRTRRIVLLVIYLVALSIANHLIVLLVAPAVVVYVLLQEPQRRGYWLSVILSLTGLYLVILKGLDLDLVGATLDKYHTGRFSLWSILWCLLIGTPEVLLRLGAHVQSWPALGLGALLGGGALWWAHRQRALGFTALAAGLFLLGFSIHFYLLIRSGCLPPVNEGRPDTFAAFWATIGREQYGSSYGLLPRQAWTLITGKTAITSAADLLDNLRVFFVHNVPFYTKYFGLQFGGKAISTLFFLVGLYGAFEHWKADRKSFWFWLTVFLVTGMILNIYMNFKLELDLSRDKYPSNELHEVRERDYFFIISYVFFGLWSGLGLAGLVNRLRLALLPKERPATAAGRAVFALLGLALFASAFTPLAKNWAKADRSGNRIPEVYARNLMNTLEKDAILFTHGDNDTFPLWYIQEVEGVRKDCRVVNLSLINMPWYIRQMRDDEPRLPISYDDSTLNKLLGFALQKPMRFEMDSLILPFDKGEVLYVKDIIVLDILRNNRWKRPIYYTTTTPYEAMTKLKPYISMEGMSYRVHPRKTAELAAVDSSIAPTSEVDLFINIPRTDSLYHQVYRYDTFFRQDKRLEGEESATVVRFGSPLIFLSMAQALRGDYTAAVETRLEARRFWMQGGAWNQDIDFTIGGMLIELGQEERALRVFDSLGVDPTLYSRIAHVEVSRGRVDQANRILQHVLERVPDYREGYAQRFMLQNNEGHQDSAQATLERYLQHCPGDTVVAQELERYRSTGEFNMTRAFNIAPPPKQQ